MKRTLLAVLLCTQTLWAAPPPTTVQTLDWPGGHTSIAQRAERLERAEADFRRKGDESGLIGIECLRLEPLLNAYHQSCPERMKKLDQSAKGLQAGPARAHYYWIVSLYGHLRQDLQTRDRFQKLAFAEPGVNAVEKARWLNLIAQEQDLTSAKHQWLETERRQLSMVSSNPQLRILVLGLQRQAANDVGDSELVYSNSISMAELATRQGWAWEEMESYLYLVAHCPELGEGAEGYWKRAWAVAQQQKSDELRLRALEDAPTIKLYQFGISQLGKPLSKDAARQHLLESRASRSSKDLVGQWKLQADWCRRSGDLEGEIWARLNLAQELNRQKRVEEAIQQNRAAYDLSLQQTAARSGWVSQRTHPFPVAAALRMALGNASRLLSQAELEESLLKSGQPMLPQQEWELRYARMLSLRSAGDEHASTREWHSLLGLTDSVPATLRTRFLSYLLVSVPAAHRPMGAELLKKTRESAERDLREAWKPSQRRYANGILVQCLNQEGDQISLRLRLQQLLDSNPIESDHTEVGRMLLSNYAASGLVEDYKRLVFRLKNEGGPRERGELLIVACEFLASRKDPQALILAEELLALSTKPGADLKNDALKVRAEVLSSFGRHQAALDSLDGLDPNSTSPSLGIVALSSYRAKPVELSRARYLTALGRKAEACALLKRQFTAQLGSELPQRVAPYYLELSQLQQELGQDWQADLETVCQRYSTLGERGEVALATVLYDWLEKLSRSKDWDKGRQLLSKYPWKLSGNHAKTKQLRAQEQWKDLLPSEKLPELSPGNTGEVRPEAQSLRELVDELRLNQPQLGELLSLRSTNLQYLQARLGPKDTLVTYCSDGDKFYLLGLRQKSSFFKRSQVSSRDLESLRVNYLKALNLEKAGDSEASLFSLLLEPVLTEDSGQRIFVVPTGSLWQVPFGALRDPTGRATASRSDVVLLTSGDLLRLADNVWSPYHLSQPLAIGAPPAADLPGAFRELGEVAAALPNCQLRRGDKATLASLYDSSKRWGLVHFASHAHYREERPLDSDIELHDGGLKVRQLSQLSLAEHALVTLSVCQGGASEGQKLGEPVTLATGFSASGAQTVVANLWPVEDEVARLFYSSFYSRLGSGDSPIKSFRYAQAQLRSKFPKAEDWAGFFLMGNPT